jgi:hypothetical protein
MEYQFISTICIAATRDRSQIETRRTKQWLKKLQPSGINRHVNGTNFIHNPLTASAAEEGRARAMPPVPCPNKNRRQFQQIGAFWCLNREAYRRAAVRESR